jgi:hypothetical protein
MQGRNKIRIMFWDENINPKNFVKVDLSSDDKTEIIKFLSSGTAVNFAKGYARCRICDEPLSSSDSMKGKYIYPTKAEHYVDKHNVWLPEFNVILKNGK